MSFLTSKYQLQNIAAYFETAAQFNKIRLVSRTFNLAVFEALGAQQADIT